MSFNLPPARFLTPLAIAMSCVTALHFAHLLGQTQLRKFPSESSLNRKFFGENHTPLEQEKKFQLSTKLMNSQRTFQLNNLKNDQNDALHPLCNETNASVLQRLVVQSSDVFDLQGLLSKITSEVRNGNDSDVSAIFRQFARALYTNSPNKGLAFSFVHDSTLRLYLCSTMPQCLLCQKAFAGKTLQAAPTRPFVGRVPCGVITQQAHVCSGMLFSSGYHMVHELVSGTPKGRCFQGCPDRKKVSDGGGVDLVSEIADPIFWSLREGTTLHE